MTIINDQEVLDQLADDLRPESLGQLTRQVLADNLDVQENQALCDLIFAAIPADMWGIFLRQALTITTPVLNAGARNAKPAEDLHETPNSTSSKRSGRNQRPGWKAEAISKWYKNKLDCRIGISGKAIPFRHCTIDQIEIYSEDLISGGEAQIVAGKRHARLVEIGRERGYSKGEDFPEDVLREVLT